MTRSLCAWLAFAVVTSLAGPAAPATITVLNLDGPGEGFNDPAPAAPVGGNAATTLGAQRLAAFQFAAGLWGAVLASDVPIQVAASFDPLDCGASFAALGEAAAQTVHANFPGAIRQDTWYTQALANKLAGSDLDPGEADIGATFNSTIGTTCPFPKTFYYGLDAAPGPNQTDFVSVVVHEIGHGLGFQTFVNLATGESLQGADDTFMVHLEDHSVGSTYPAMSEAQRVAASTDSGDLHWIGPQVVAGSGGLTSGVHPSGHVEMYAPDPQEPGSSVLHFSTSLFPNELMEPMYTGPNHDVGLSLALMRDIGWGAGSGGSVCGNDVVEAGESCDDGNTVGGDCCSAVCQTDPADTPCTDDADPCTDDVCASTGACAHFLDIDAADVDCELGRLSLSGLCAAQFDAKTAAGVRKLAKQARAQLSQAELATTDARRGKKLLKTQKKLQALGNKLAGPRAIRKVESGCLDYLQGLASVLLEIVEQLPRTVTPPLSCDPGETNCDTFCCPAQFPACAVNADACCEEGPSVFCPDAGGYCCSTDFPACADVGVPGCCPADFPVFCRDDVNGAFCCPANFPECDLVDRSCLR